MQTEGSARFLRALGRALLGVSTLLALHCGATREDPTGGETHFLKQCEGDASCGDDLSCVCGLCTLPCSASSACGRFPAADCVSPPRSESCEPQTAGICDVTCTVSDDCAWLSASHVCAAGVCRSQASPPRACSQGDVSANEVVIVGDAFFAASHGITAFLEELARQSGAIAAGERYRDASRVVDNTLALTGAGIENQYAAASSESPVKVVIMTGGGADVLIGSCDVVSADCPLLVAATDAARALFQRFASDGVEAVVYAFYPDPSEAELREKIDALRPLLESACGDSPVPCHWVDLRDSFAGHEDAYLGATGTAPTSAGAEVAARQIWGVMKAECIAQASE